jgi:polycystin 1L2
MNNQITIGHQSVIFGLRELNATEIDDFCSNQSINNPPISDQPLNFSSNYELRTYTSGCYSLDLNKQWQSNGLIVGPLTNHFQTQCFSTHVATFASGFLVLPSPINWNYVFANANFMRNKTIYLTVICICLIYILLMIYARYKDKKDLDKLGVTILPDNHRQDQYFYQIIIFTGHRRDAGTESKVKEHDKDM